MSYSYDKFLRPITTSDKVIKILDNTNDIKYTVNPFVVTNTAVDNNLLRISLKSLKVIIIDFSTQNEAKLALMRFQKQIDTLTSNVPALIDKDIQNYIQSQIQQIGTISGPTGPQGPQGVRGPQGPQGVTGSADRYYGTSSTTFEIPVLEQVINLVTQPNLGYKPIQSVIIYNNFNFYDYNYEQDDAYFIGQIDSYDSQTGDMSLITTYTFGTGTYSFWYINLSGMVAEAATSSTVDLTNLTTDIIPAV